MRRRGIHTTYISSVSPKEKKKIMDEEYDEYEENYYDDELDMESDDYLIDNVGFADPGGNSALRAETRDNPRNLPCPTCGEENRLTPLDKRRGYQCDDCAEGRGY